MPVDWRRGAEVLVAPRSRRICLLVGAVVGAIAMVFAFGPGFVLGTSKYWDYPLGDPKVHTVGLAHFVREPWSWPPGVSRTMAPPEGMSITFTDSIPLMALPLKLIEPMIPSALDRTLTRPFGLWLLFAFAMNGLMVARCARRLGAGSILGVGLTALFACTLPALLWRWGHLALCAHFLLVWGVLLVVIAQAEPPSRRRALEWIALLAAASMTHPYLLAMTATLFLGWIGTIALNHGRVAWKAIAATAAAVIGALVAVFGMLGLLSGNTITGHPWGYGVASFNPASLVLSKWSVLLRFLPVDHGDATGFQYEGYDYLGAGLLIVVVAALVLRGRSWTSSLRRHAILGVTLIALVGYALSNHVYVGKTELLAFEVPTFAERLTSQFRSSGRFVWPATYALLVFAVAQVTRTKYGYGILIGAALVQLADLRAHYKYLAEWTGSPEERTLDWPTWHDAVHAHDTLWSTPTFDCVGWFRPTDKRSYTELHEISFIAALEAVTVNSAANPRPRRACADDIQERESLVVRDGTAYVFERRVTTGHAIGSLEKQGATCYPAGGGYFCSSRIGKGSPIGNAFTRSFVAGPYADGEWLGFGAGSPTSAIYEGPGWGPVEANRVWTGQPPEGDTTTIHFIVGPGAPRTAFALELDADAAPNQAVPVPPMNVEANGMRIGSLRPAGEGEHHRFCVPADLPGGERFVIVDLVRTTPSVPGLPPKEIALRRARLVAGPCDVTKID